MRRILVQCVGLIQTRIALRVYRFTHILSIEMFEHMKGYPALFAKLATWLQPGGKVFIHVFCHKDTPYDFEENDGWMSKNFFSGGTMPSVGTFWNAHPLGGRVFLVLFRTA